MYMRVVIRMALSISRKYDLSLSDTIQDGMIGLWTAIDKYEFGKNDVFTTYFPFWVRQAIMREAATRNPTVYFPAHIKDKLFNIYDLVDSHACDQCGWIGLCPKLLFEIAKRVECDLDEAKQLYRYIVPFESLEEVSEELEHYEDSVADEVWYAEDAFEELFDKSIQGEIITIMKEHLSSREQVVLSMRCGLMDDRIYTLDMIGTELGLTRERVRQIESKAIRKMRSHLQIGKSVNGD